MAGLLEWMDNSASIVLLDFLGIAQHQLKDRFLFNFLCLGWFFFFCGFGGVSFGLVGLIRIWFGLLLFFTEEENKETTFLVSMCVKVPGVHQLSRLGEIQPTSVNSQLDPASSNSRRTS